MLFLNELKCKNCGRPLKAKQMVFCSQKCLGYHKRESYKGSGNPNWKHDSPVNNYKYKKLQKKRHPERVNARQRVYFALKNNRITKGVCEICGNEKVEAHHDDYSKPLEVRWLCRKHHIEFHIFEKM